MDDYLSTSFKGFLKFEVSQYLMRKRWLIVPATMIFITWFSSSAVQAHSFNYRVATNIWDVLFSTFGNGHIVFIALTLSFLYLTSDLATTTDLDEALLLRIGSKRKWWMGKAAVLILSVVLYISGAVISSVLYASLQFPLACQWSEGAQIISEALFVVPRALTSPPFFIFIQLLILLVMGWIALGLLVAVATQLFNNAFVAFAIGIIMTLSGYFTFKASLVTPFSMLTLDRHLLYGPHSFGDPVSPYPSVSISLLYWSVLIILLFFAGYRFSGKRDFL